MFSKSLFKQSCKANGTMWVVITFAVCFMLACVMTIAGGSNIADSKNAIQNTIIKDELTAQISTRSLNYYNLGCNSLLHFDDTMKVQVEQVTNSTEAKKAYDDAYKASQDAGEFILTSIAKATQAKKDFIALTSYTNTMEDFLRYTDEVVIENGFELDQKDGLELKAVMLSILNPMIEKDVYAFDELYIENNEEPARYDIEGVLKMNDKDRKIYRQEYASKGSIIMLSANAIKEENMDLILSALSSYGVTYELYKEFGFTDYRHVKDIASTAQVNYRANLAYRLENIKEGETEESIIKDLTTELSKSLLASLPTEVATALDEIGQSDLFGILVGSIYFKMAGLLLPIIYMIMTANNLIAGQVDSGSMAYILSTGTKRRTVILTQALYLVGSLFAMFACTTVTSIICLACINVETELTFGKLALINLGAFIVMFAMSGISFLTSCWFNRAKRSMAIGGGLNMFFLVATMLGLFGSTVLPSIVRMDALNIFNYVSIISLFNVVSILEGTYTFIWELGILVVLGIICYLIGSEKFVKKDLPL